MHAAIPAGATDMVRTVPAATLPPGPGATARAGTVTLSAPAARTASSTVSKATDPAVRHTVPAGTVSACSAACRTEKVSVPSARSASRRVRPRSAACRSSASPAAVCGKHWASVQAHSSYRP